MRVSVRRTPETPAGTPVSTPAIEEATLLEPASAPSVTNGLVRVEAPMVGTFYRAPQPGAPPFVEEGDAIASGQTLCVLEAMKLMNEIKAELEGIVRKIHVQNGQPVEFGQLLFEVEPLPGRPLV
jgi:acetyl-CoA carboxylase biotin carboxyl carrier protein